MTPFGSLASVPDSGAVRKGLLGKMSASRLIAFSLLGLSVVACTADSGPKEVGGTAAGALAGGLIGNAIGGSVGNRAAGTVIGAAIGGLFGNRIGAAMDDEDKRRAYAAQMQALKAAGWKGELRRFEGGHGIPPELLPELGAWLQAR